MANTQTNTPAKSTPPGKLKGGATPPIDAVTLLKQDHAVVKALFKKFEDAETEEQEEIADQVCKLLTVHATIEEEIFYPAAREAFTNEEDEELVNEAEVEHGSAKELIALIEDMTSQDEKFTATVKVLSEQIEHHVKEEESEFFPKLKKTGIDLQALGAELSERKDELIDELGLDEADADEEDEQEDE